jgi:hypothetical protein
MMESLLSGIPGEYSGVYEKQIVFSEASKDVYGYHDFLECQEVKIRHTTFIIVCL